MQGSKLTFLLRCQLATIWSPDQTFWSPTCTYLIYDVRKNMIFNVTLHARKAIILNTIKAARERPLKPLLFSALSLVLVMVFLTVI